MGWIKTTGRRVTDDPLIDANILIQASPRFSNPNAIKFLTENRGRLSFGRTTKHEYLKVKKYGATQAELSYLTRQFNLTCVDVNRRAIIGEARKLRRAFSGTSRQLKLMDSRQLATARLTGIDFVTNDLNLFKRAKDLGIPVHYVDLFPGPGGTSSRAAQNAAIYSPQGVLIP